MGTIVNCFFAYPANPPALSEVIEKSIDEINNLGKDLINAHGWKTLGVSGKIIIQEVCKAIDDCDLFICDLTYLNPNVLFELGYAIARNRRIWITLDISFDESKQNYERFSLLRGIGYAGYQNSNHFTGNFFNEHPYDDLQSTVYSNLVKPSRETRDKQLRMFYLKSRVESEASIELSRLLKASRVPMITDDPQENNSQPLQWYINNAFNSEGAIVHLLDEKRDAKFNQNGKYAFVSGILFGFDRPLLMLAHAPYKSPIDYSDLLFVHETAGTCVSTASAWITRIGEHLSYERQRLSEQSIEIENKLALRNIYLGQDQAENEQIDLIDYFIPTAAYQEALRLPQSIIFIGRKGCGKTANLIKIAATLDEDPRNHVCVIKPVGYELEGVLRLLRMSMSKAEQGFMLESLWKFLIYTELALSVYQELERKPVYYVKTPGEEELYKYVDDHKELIKSEFAIRMENAIQNLCEISPSPTLESQRAKVSEILHSQILGQLRELLGIVLAKREKACVLIDNLDKSWIRGIQIDLLSDFLFSLLSVSRVISGEFNKPGSKYSPVRLSLIVFLRSDIFSYIMKRARERDKLGFRRLQWEDPTLLQRVIEERFLEASNRELSSEKVWHTFFTESIGGIATKDYIVQKIVPRPRDIIFFCRAALSHAVNCGHNRIEEEDINQAEIEYSHYAFNSLEAETSTQLDQVEELLYEFVGANKVITRKQIEEFFNKASIQPEKVQSGIDLLVASTFLGVETHDGQFGFMYDENKEEVIRVLARKQAEKGEERYMINAPFYSYLEIN